MPMPTYKNTNYSLFYITLAIMVICCLTITGAKFIKPAINKMLAKNDLKNFQRAFRDLQHPADTARLSLRSSLCVLTDAEQGCDVFVGEIRQFDGDQQAISTFYTDQSVRSNPIQVAFLEEGRLPVQVSVFLPETLNTLSGWDLPPGSAGKPMYLVYLLVAALKVI